MKKILLMLSCCLATWCSVQAGPKCSASGSELSSSPECSMLPASAPVATPPAVIESASYDPKTRMVNVTFTVDRGSSVSFDLEATGRKPAENVYVAGVLGGSVSFPIPEDWELANAVVIRVDGERCGGASLTQPAPVKPTAKINVISYDPLNGIATVCYSAYNPNNQYDCLLKVKVDGSDEPIFSDRVSSGLNSYQLSLPFEEGKNYYIEVSCGDARGGQNFDIGTSYSGHIDIDALYFVNSQSYNPDYGVFKYNLKNAKDPYMVIKKGDLDENGSEVKKIKVSNTNGVDRDFIFYVDGMRAKTRYTAFLYDGSKYLGISSNRSFEIPEDESETYYLDAHFDNGSNTLSILAPAIWPSYIKDVTVRVCGVDVLFDVTRHGQRDVPVVIQIPASSQRRCFTITVTAGSYKCSRTMPISK